MSNISQILSKKMCSGCGACVSICPKECIKLTEGKYVNFPTIDQDKCIDCGLCIKTCPGEINAKRLIDGNKVDLQLGIKDIKVSYSTDRDLRIKSASGGIITQTLKSMFENNKIDAAVIVVQNKKNVLLNEVRITDNVEELIRSQGSRYSPSSNCIAIKDIIKSNYKRVAFVGKPCDIEALSRYESLNKVLKEKIVMKIAIMCHHSPTRKGLVELIKAKGINANEISEMSFRGDGWPGKFKIIKENGEIFSTSYFDAWNNHLSKDYNEKCNYCENPFPLEADIIVGDPWGEEFKDDNIGRSLIIIRSDRASRIINELEKSGEINSENSSYENVKRYQKFLLQRHNEFKINSMLYRSVHGYKNNARDYFELFMENPKDLLRYIKRKKTYKKNFELWEYK